MNAIDLPQVYHLAAADESDLPPASGRIGVFSVHICRDSVCVLDTSVRKYAGSRRVVMEIDTYHIRRNGIRYRVMNYTRMDNRYRGCGIAPLVYEIVAKKSGPIMSGDSQSPGGRAIWNSIIKRGKVFAAALWKGSHYSVEGGEWGEAESDEVSLYRTAARLVAV